MQQVLKQLEGVDIQVIGGLIQNQHVGRTGKQARQQQTIALATGQGTHGRRRTRRGKKEITKVALHMLALISNAYPFAARADEVFQGRVQIQRVAQLVEVGDFQVGPLPQFASFGYQFAQDEFEQGGFADAVVSNQSNLVAAQNRGAEIADDHLFCEGKPHVGEFGDQFAARRSPVHVQPDASDRVAPCRAAFAQDIKSPNAALAAGPSCLDALAHPYFLLGEQLVRLGVDNQLLRDLVLLLRQIAGKVARVGAKPAAVKLDNAGRDAVQKCAIVRDRHNAASELEQQ